MNHPYPSRCAAKSIRERGIALILVIWVLAFLSVIAAEFCRSMRTEVNIARNYKESTQAYYTALGGLNLALRETMRSILLPLPLRAEEEEEENRIKWRINADLPEIPIGDGRARIRIDNEGGRLNINLANEALIEMVFSGFGLPEDRKRIIVDSILDWRDRDGLHRLNGAENDYYRSLPDPYPCKNDDFDSPEELLLVRGITPELYYEAGLADVVTVYPSRKTAEKKMGWRENGPSAAGMFDFNKININAAPPRLLQLLPGFDAEVLEAVNAGRLEKDFRGGADLLSQIGVKPYADTIRFITYDLSPCFRISVSGTNAQGDMRQGVAAVVRFDLKTQEKYYIMQWIDYETGSKRG